jgi:hypothetical protein
MWHHRESRVEIKLKADRSMRWATSDSSTPTLLFFIVLDHKGNLVISFSIIRTPMAGGEVSTQPSLSHPVAIVAFGDVWVCFMV